MARKKPICLSILFGILIALLSVKAASATQEEKYAPAIDMFVFNVAIPTYRTLSERFTDLEASVAQLCAAPGGEAYDSAKAEFRNSVLAWSAAEVIRFGPIRQENRLERIFFWPDTRSRGLRKVTANLAKGDIQAGTDLAGRTVAVQGLPALEFLLFGTGHENLSAKEGDPARCNFAMAVSHNLSKIARDLVTAWEMPDGYQRLLKHPGAENPLFRTTGEVLQEILKSGSELIELTVSAKLQSPLGTAEKSAKPKRAAFWRSGLTVENIQANVQAVVTLQEKTRLFDLLPEADKGYARTLEFEAGQVTTTLQRLIQDGRSWPELLSDPEARSLLQYVVNPLNGMKDILSIYYPEALGLKLGFNSLDGD